MSTPPVVERRLGRVLELTMDNPAQRNALTPDTSQTLTRLLRLAHDDAGIGAIVLRGEGEHFCAGGNLKTLSEMRASQPPQAIVARINHVNELARALRGIAKPVIAAVEGHAAGAGFSIALGCDLVVAADNAYFASAYRNSGLTPDGGGSWALPRLVGTRRAMEIMLLAERFDARQALAWGLVNRVVPAAELDAAVAAVVASLCEGPRLAIRNAKRLVRESLARTLSEQLDAEATSFGACAATADFAEGIGAFLEKRPARFNRDR